MSVNQIFQGRRFKTKEYKKWRKDGLLILPKKKMIEGDVMVELRFGVKYPKKLDVDNLCKGTLDLIVEKGYIEDDRKINLLVASKFKTEKEMIKIIIKKIV